MASQPAFSTVQFDHVPFCCAAVALCLLHCSSAQISETQELSTGTPYPAPARQHFAAEPGEPFKGLRKGKKKNAAIKRILFKVHIVMALVKLINKVF